MNDTETRVNWRDIDTTTMEGLQALKREIGLRLGYDADDPLTDDPWKDWQSDLNAAVCLPIRSDRGYMELRRWDDGLTEARVMDFLTWKTNYPEHHREMSAALAWCKAWLSWHDVAHAETESDNLTTESEG